MSSTDKDYAAISRGCIAELQVVETALSFSQHGERLALFTPLGWVIQSWKGLSSFWNW
jgi:hypothetical protein